MWETLGIQATSNIKDIKRAYAGQLKITNPEENPEAFQALRSAYERALIYAENKIVHNLELKGHLDATENLISVEPTTFLLDTKLSKDNGINFPPENNTQNQLWRKAESHADDLCNKLCSTFTSNKAKEIIDNHLMEEWLVSIDSKHVFERCLINNIANKIDEFSDEPLAMLIKLFNWSDLKHVLWQEEYEAMTVVWNDYQNRTHELLQIKNKPTRSVAFSGAILAIFMVIIFIQVCSKMISSSSGFRPNANEQQQIDIEMEKLKRDGTIKSISIPNNSLEMYDELNQLGGVNQDFLIKKETSTLENNIDAP